MLDFLAQYNEWSLLLLRVVVGLIFFVHGWPKIKNLAETAVNFEAMGFRPGKSWGTIVALNEFFGSLAFITGFLVPLFGLTLAGQMVVATLWKMRRGQGLANGYELDLLLVVSVLVLATYGSGMFSLDELLWLRGM